MPFNGSGGFVPVPPPDYPPIPGQPILAEHFITNVVDIHSGLSSCITRDGQSPATGNLPMGGFRHTGAGAATASGNYTVYGQAGAQFGDGLVVGNGAQVGTGFTTGSDVTLGALIADLLPKVTGVRSIGSSALSYLKLWTQAVERSSAGALEINASDAAGMVQLRTAGAARLTVDQHGRLYGANLHNNAQGIEGVLNQYIGSGIYTPATSLLVNLTTVTVQPSPWLRVGNVVFASLYCTLAQLTSTTPGTLTTFEFTLPIPTTISVVSGGSGLYQTAQNSAQDPVRVAAPVTTTTGRVIWHVGTANGSPGSRTLNATYAYEVT